MYHLLAAALIFTFGTATTLATAKLLQNWAVSKYDAPQHRGDIDVAARPAELPNSAKR